MAAPQSNLALPVNDAHPTGIHQVTIRLNPYRIARILEEDKLVNFINIVHELCQIWGGGQIPIVPTTQNTIPEVYQAALINSAVDEVEKPAMPNPENDSFISISSEKEKFTDQFLYSLFGYNSQNKWLPVSTTQLDTKDPWLPIYAACLGQLPANPSWDLLKGNRLEQTLTFDDFLTVKREKAKGSIDDLIQRMTQHQTISPRQLTLFQLSSNDRRFESLFPEPSILPKDGVISISHRRLFIVVCSESTADWALLWNLVGATDGTFLGAVGVPHSEFNQDFIDQLLSLSKTNHQIRVSEFIVTSATYSSEDLKTQLSLTSESEYQKLRFSDIENTLQFGPTADQTRIDTALFENGSGIITPSLPGADTEVYSKSLLNTQTLMSLSIEISGWNLPRNLRLGNHHYMIIDGRIRSLVRIHNRTEPYRIIVPSRQALLESSLLRQNLRPTESEPGKVVRLLLERMGGIHEVINLLHRPLLELFDEMASKQGINWYKQKSASQGENKTPGSDAVAEHFDDMSHFSFAAFKKVFSNKSKSTQYWLHWAEKKGLIIKGFVISCENCDTDQWLAVNGLKFPAICNGCGTENTTPFTDKVTLNFSYKLSELMRRVYRCDAMGHMLAAYYFLHVLTQRKLVGWHPGLELRCDESTDPIGEVDFLLFDNENQKIPVEVKKSHRGVTDRELNKLEELRKLLNSKWSALVICEYAQNVRDQDLRTLIVRNVDGSYKRIVLTFDQILNLTPVWAFQEDPFKLEVLDSDAINKRETEFVDRLYLASQDSKQPFHEYILLKTAEEPYGLTDF